MSRKKGICVNCGAPCYKSKSISGVDCCAKCRHDVAKSVVTGGAYFEPSESVIELGGVITPARPKLTALEIEKLAKTNQAAQFKMKPQALSLDVHIDTGKPVTMVFMADAHFGALATDYAKIRECIDFVLKNDGFCLANVGDWIDNFFKFFNQAPVHEQVVTPQMQLEWWLEIVLDLAKAGKAVVEWPGNHDDMRWQRELGMSLTQFITSNIEKHTELLQNYARFDGMGLLNLHVGKQHYTILGNHKWSGRSVHNKLYGHQKAITEHGSVDAVIGAHFHVPAYSTFPKTGSFAKTVEYVHLVQCGAAKGADLYSTQNSFRPGIYGTPCLTFMPNEHRIIYHEGPLDALIYSKGLEK